MSSLPPPTMRRARPTAPTQPKTMAERVADVKGRMTSGPSTGPVINRPVSRPTGPTADPVINRPVTPRTGPTTGPMNPGPMPPPTMKKGGYVKNGGQLNLGSGRVSTATKNKKNPNF